MIHVRAAIKVPGGSKHGPLHGFYTSSGFGPPNTKEQIRRGILLATVASVLVLVGCILTWLVYTEVFGSKVPIMGPLVMTLGVLLVVLSIRQFYIVWKHKQKSSKADKAETVPAEDEDMPCDGMMEMETWDTGECEKSSHFQNNQQMAIYNQFQPGLLGYMVNTSILPPSCAHITTTTATITQPLTQPMQPPQEVCAESADQPLQAPQPSSISPVTATDDSKVKSCCDLSSMARSASVDVQPSPNPRPVIRYSQGQLELLDREAAMGRTSPTLVANAPSHHSLGDRSTSPQDRISHKSLSLSIERTDVLETI